MGLYRSLAILDGSGYLQVELQSLPAVSQAKWRRETISDYTVSTVADRKP